MLPISNGMKEISYEGSPYKKEESEWLKKRRRTAPPPESAPALDARQVKLPIAITPPTSENIEQRTAQSKDEDHHLGFIIFILTLVLAFGVGVGAYVLIGIDKKPEPVAQKAVEVAEVNTVQHTDILLSDSPRAQILVDIALAFKNTHLKDGGIHHVTFAVNDTNGKTRPATVSEVFQAIRSERIPDTLFHSLEPDIAYEIHPGISPAGRLTLSSRSAPHTFGALFDWERGFSQTLIPLLHPLLNTSYLRDIEDRKFHDERIGEIDARVLVDIMGDVVLIYGFIDPKTLVIAGSREAFLNNTSKIAE